MKINMNACIHNRFDFKLVDAATGAVKQEATSYNIVLNSFYESFVKTSKDWSIDTIVFGTGTGTLDPAVTTLFQSLYASDVTATKFSLLDDGINQCVYKTTLSELVCVGLLSEVGLGAAANRLLTHSLITDSEGNPTTINKTDADILYVTATVWSELSHGETPFNFVRCESTNPGQDPITDAATPNAIADCEPSYLVQKSLSGGNLSAAGVYYSVQSKPIYGDGRLFTSATGTLARLTEDTIRLSHSAIASTAGNRNKTLLIRSVLVKGYGFATFPNHQLYPPKQHTFSLTGDGVTSDFNFPLPELMTEGVTVTVDSVPLSASEYVFGGKNFDFEQAWCSQDNQFLIKRAGSVLYNNDFTVYGYTFPQYYDVVGHIGYYAQPLTTYEGNEDRCQQVYDFITPKTVNTLASRNMSTSYAAPPLELYSSDDGENWVLRSTMTEPNQTITFDDVAARFWKLDKCIRPTGLRTTTGLCGAFDKVTPGIHFNTPPANGAAITVTASCEYPIKNQNWRIDPMVLDLTISRGQGG